MATVPISRASVDKVSNDLKRQVQVFKVRVSRADLSKLQANDQFPPDKNITSYVTSTNQKNRYKNLHKFWSVMEKAPKYWDKRFIYIPDQEGGALNERIAKAAREAYDIAERQYQSYPKISSTGHLRESIRTTVNGDITRSTTSAILESTGAAYFQMYNTAEYASTAEARAVYVTQQRGLIFYAANRIQTKYPDLGIKFHYIAQSEHGLPHKYDIPVLTISSKENVSGKWARPGSRIRGRRREARRNANLFRRFRERNLG